MQGTELSFIVDLPIQDGDLPVRYISLPEGTATDGFHTLIVGCMKDQAMLFFGNTESGCDFFDAGEAQNLSNGAHSSAMVSDEHLMLHALV